MQLLMEMLRVFVWQTMCTGISLPLTIGLVMLLIWNLHLALHNKTTIEFHEGVTAKVQVSARHTHLTCHSLPVPSALDTCGFAQDHAALVLLFLLRLELLLWSLCCVALTGSAVRLQARRAGTSYRHPYDLGLCGNLHAICGEGPLTWLLPTRAAAHGDGLSFASAWDASAGGPL